MITAYIALFSFYCYRRHWSYNVGDWDLGIIEQSFYTAARLHLPFFNTFENMSHFGFHNSAVFLLLLPIYSLLPYTMTLLTLQTVALALGAIPVYLLGRDMIGSRAGLAFSTLYLLNFPLHGVNYHEFHEVSFIIGPLLLALWGLRCGRRGWMWSGALIALIGREDMGVLIFGMGLLGLYWRTGRGVQPTEAANRRPPLVDCAGLMAIGVLWTYVSMRVVMPAYGGEHALADVHLKRLAHLGSGPLEWLASPIIHPVAFWGRILDGPGISYLLGLFGPLAFLPLLAWPTLLVMLPELVLNLESSFGGMHLFTSHYAGPLIPFVFCAGIEGAAMLVKRRFPLDAPNESSRQDVALRILRPAAMLTVLLMLAFDPSPLHVGRWPQQITDHSRALDEVCASIPPDAAVSAAPNLWTHLDHRLHAYPLYREDAEYIVLDETQPQFLHEAHFDDSLPPLLAQKKYVLERTIDSPPGTPDGWKIRVYRKSS